jgi:protein-S-isoprenylcysteine O-methyltransferase Ste14
MSAFFNGFNPIYLLVVLSQSQLVIFFFIRSDAKKISSSFFEYIVAILGTFLVLLYRPTDEYIGTLAIIGDILVYIAVCIEVWAIWSLNTSFGIVAANRGIKKGGMYKLIRHPIYLGSIFLYIGYTCINPSLFNLIILLTALMCQIVRIQREERLLKYSSEYVEYTKEVKYRLIPGIY